VARLDDAPYAAAGHHFADFHRPGIGRRVAHAAALVGIRREIVNAYQELALPGRVRPVRRGGNRIPPASRTAGSPAKWRG
jgi:hypothetical protein